MPQLNINEVGKSLIILWSVFLLCVWGTPQVIIRQSYLNVNRYSSCDTNYPVLGMGSHVYGRCLKIFVIIIIMFMKSQVCFLFLNSQGEVCPSISSSVVLCSFVLLVDTVVLVLLFYFCPSSVRVVATFPGIVFFPLLRSVLQFFP